MVMAFCKNCGIQMEDGIKFCPACGTAMEATPQSAAGSIATAEKKDAADNKVMAILAYILVLIPIFAAKDSKFARYHSNQGLILLLAAIAYGVAFSVLSTLLVLISWRLALAVTGILGLLGWVFLAFSIIGIMHACKGEMKPLPLIGGFRILK